MHALISLTLSRSLQVLQCENLNPLSQNPLHFPSKAFPKMASEGSKNGILLCLKTSSPLIGLNSLSINNIMHINYEIIVFSVSQNPLISGQLFLTLSQNISENRTI
jgi:hypothetical protein